MTQFSYYGVGCAIAVALGSCGGGSDGGSPSSGGDGGTGATVQGLGVACDKDEDCNAPLKCHVDTEGYLAHKQCTITCTSQEECTGKFGSASLCIGAQVCVAKCSTSADCTEKSICNASKWCMRSGPGSGIPTCSGSASPCAGKAESACTGTLGCSFELGSCNAAENDCSGKADSASCGEANGCTWNSVSGTCASSVAESCSAAFDQATCTGRSGCSWTAAACSGTPNSCELVAPARCSNQTGCSITQ